MAYLSLAPNPEVPQTSSAPRFLRKVLKTRAIVALVHHDRKSASHPKAIQGTQREDHLAYNIGHRIPNRKRNETNMTRLADRVAAMAPRLA
jgi:hypothetical protein